MDGTITIRASAYDELLASACDTTGAISSTYYEACRIIRDGIVKPKEVILRNNRSVTDYVCCSDMFLSETLRQLDAQGSEIVSVSQCGHQYTIFFRTVAYG